MAVTLEDFRERTTKRNAQALAALKDIAPKISKEIKALGVSSDDIDVDVTQIDNLLKIAELTKTVEVGFNNILDTPAIISNQKRMMAYTQSLSQLILAISQYKRDDAVKDCLKEIREIVYYIGTVHCLAQISYHDDILAQIPEDRRPQRKPPPTPTYPEKRESIVAVMKYAHKSISELSDISGKVQPSEKTKSIVRKKKYLLFAAGAAVGIAALGLCIAFPPALGCGAVIALAYGAGVLDGVVGTAIAARDAKIGLKDDSDQFDYNKNLQSAIELLLRDRTYREEHFPSTISPSTETQRILQSFNLIALNQEQKKVERSIESISATVDSTPGIPDAAKENTQEIAGFCSLLLETSDKIEALNQELLSSLKQELNSSDISSEEIEESRKNIIKKIDNIVSELKELKKDSMSLKGMTPENLDKIQQVINYNADNVRTVNSDLKKLISNKIELKQQNAELIYKRIAKAKRSKVIAVVGAVIAVTAIALAVACPFVGPPLVGAAVAVFAATVVVGAIGTAMAAVDAPKAHKELKSEQEALANNTIEVENLESDQEALESTAKDIENLFNTKASNPMESNADIVGAGHRESHEANHEIEVENKSKPKGADPSSPAQPLRLK